MYKHKRVQYELVKPSKNRFFFFGGGGIVYWNVNIIFGISVARE